MMLVSRSESSIMVSQRRLEANRLNAKRSTGPKTESAKALASRNSLKHGLTSQQIVIGDEDPHHYEELRRGLEKDFKPTTTIETALVDRLAGLLWRLQRVSVFEASLMQARLEEVGPRDILSAFSPEERWEIREGMQFLQGMREFKSLLEAKLGPSKPTLSPL